MKSRVAPVPHHLLHHGQSGGGEAALKAGQRIGRLGAWLVGAMFCMTGMWMVLAPLNGAVVTPSQFKVVNYRKTVQHLEGGIVRAVLVKAGDRVKAGQVLVQLEDVQADAAVKGLQDQLDAEAARGARIKSEMLKRLRVEYPALLLARSQNSPGLRSLLSAEAEIFQARQGQLHSQLTLLRAQTNQVKAEMAGLTAQISAAVEDRKLISDELAINEDLFRREFVQKTRLMSFQRAIAEKDERRGGYDAEHAKAQQKLTDLGLRIIGVQDEYLKRASDEHAESNRRLLDLQERLRPMSDVLSRQVVTAPITGEVVDLRVHSVGATIAPREVLMDLVPAEHTLLLEGRVRPEDIAELAVGQPVDVQVNAFRQRSTAPVRGRLIYVSGDSLNEVVSGMAAPYYLVHVEVNPAELATLPGPVTPGMPATLFIQTQPRTALQYLMQPLTDSMSGAFRER